MRRRRIECKRGHPYDNENTYVSKDGMRMCRICRNEARRREAAKRRAPWALRRVEYERTLDTDADVVLCRAELERVLRKNEERRQVIHAAMDANRARWADAVAIGKRSRAAR